MTIHKIVSPLSYAQINTADHQDESVTLISEDKTVFVFNPQIIRVDHRNHQLQAAGMCWQEPVEKNPQLKALLKVDYTNFFDFLENTGDQITLEILE